MVGYYKREENRTSMLGERARLGPCFVLHIFLQTQFTSIDLKKLKNTQFYNFHTCTKLNLALKVSCENKLGIFEYYAPLIGSCAWELQK